MNELDKFAKLMFKVAVDKGVSPEKTRNTIMQLSRHMEDSDDVLEYMDEVKDSTKQD